MIVTGIFQVNFRYSQYRNIYLWMIEGTLDIAAVWEEPADNRSTSRGCSFKGRAKRSCNWDLDN